ncbi:hypothetical protein VTK73DRAFT_7453 [Phialemonium thermophilum]|uniref:Uncharacterized protein n=1 Tax=Phialemonium thermophilum TaxID=223376 RepID=A0ABR3WEQ2_9PEZI
MRVLWGGPHSNHTLFRKRGERRGARPFRLPNSQVRGECGILISLGSRLWLPCGMEAPHLPSNRVLVSRFFFVGNSAFESRILLLHVASQGTTSREKSHSAPFRVLRREKPVCTKYRTLFSNVEDRRHYGPQRAVTSAPMKSSLVSGTIHDLPLAQQNSSAALFSPGPFFSWILRFPYLSLFHSYVVVHLGCTCKPCRSFLVVVPCPWG